ncbi:MAG: hypothetical protein AAGF13_01305 [Pseudomonadota bacterium]
MQRGTENKIAMFRLWAVRFAGHEMETQKKDALKPHELPRGDGLSCINVQTIKTKPATEKDSVRKQLQAMTLVQPTHQDRGA